MKDVRRETEPHDELTRMAAEMLALVPEGVQAIVMLERDEAGATCYQGFGDDSEAVVLLFCHLQAIFQANGKQLGLVPVREG